MPFWRPNRSDLHQGAYTLSALEPACVGSGDYHFFMGGVGMAAAIHALQDWTEKPLLWATIQFISHGMRGDDLTLRLDQIGGGRRIVQTRAQLFRGDELLQQMVAALGAREGEQNQQFAKMPNVSAPEDCPPKADDAFQQEGNLIDQFERRAAREAPESGLEWMWIRPKFQADIDASLLSLISDFFLGAHPRTRRGTSLDNTFRLYSVVPTDWILSCTEITGIANGAAHGHQKLFAQDGTLLSISSQTGLLPRS
ncbi:MAG: hypothetical protein AAFZ74_15140 [Pseudomonadota bacterium]